MAARSDRLKAGRQLGRYEVVRSLRRDGPFLAYVARAAGAIGFEKRFVLQVLTPGKDDERLAKALVVEARAAALLEHPNVAAIVDLGRADEHYYLASELVEGVDLATLMRVAADAQLPVPAVLHVAIAVAGALQHAHDRTDLEGEALGVLHLGLCPQVIMLRPDGEVKLSGFVVSCARVTAARGAPNRNFVGLRYAAPELLAGRALDPRTDVFALGAVLYELLAGNPCFAGDEAEVRRRIRTGRVTPLSEARPGIDPRLEDTVMQCLAVDPEGRPPSADALRLDLLHLAASRGLQPSSVAMRDVLVAHQLDASSVSLSLAEDGSVSEVLPSSDSHPAVTFTGGATAEDRRPWWPWLLVATIASAAATAGWWLSQT